MHTITLKVTDTHGAYNNATAIIEITGPANRAPVPKITEPTEGQSFYKSDWITFNAGGVGGTTDLDGDTLTYTWVSSLDGVLTGNAISFQHKLSEGEHRITLYVNDGTVNVSKMVNITVKNHAPLASFVSNSPKNIGDTVTFTANATSDPDGQADLENMTYTWTFGDGGTGSGKVATHVYSVAGQYNVNLNVSDASASHATNETNRQIRINTPPIAVAGEDVSVMVGVTVQFDASGSSDPDGDPITFKWDFGDGSTLSGAKVSHSFTNAGTYTVKLTVNDGVGTGDDTLKVTVKGAALPPVANAGDDRMVNFNDTDKFTVAFDGSLSYDPADDINNDSIIDEGETNNLTFFWDFNANVDKNKDGNFTNDEEAKVVKPTFTYSEANDYLVTLTVKNKAGLEASASVTITMNYYPQPTIAEKPYGLMDTDITFSASGSTDSF